MSRVVLGIGMSSKATGEEVHSLVARVVRRAGLGADAVTALATRARYADDSRVTIGFPVVAVDDAVLLDRFPEPSRSLFPARVAEGCALIAAGPDSSLLVPTVRSPHVTAAMAAMAAGVGARAASSGADTRITSTAARSGGRR